MHKSKNIVHINTKAKRSQTSCLQEVWPFYSLTSVKDGSITHPHIFVNFKRFFTIFHISTILKASNTYKRKDILVIEIFQYPFLLIFSNRIMYMSLITG